MAVRCVKRASPGFTLIELLVVVSIIALLVGILVPALHGALNSGRAGACAAQLKGQGTGLVTWSVDNQNRVLPSYTMTGTQGGTSVPLEGWACILDKLGYAPGSENQDKNVFYCPSTKEVAGVADGGQTGTNPEHPLGFMQWPTLRLGSQMGSTTIPERGFNRILKVSYWMNADNPIGGVATIEPGIYFSGSVGYGPDGQGNIIKYNSYSNFVRPSQLIALSDGLYAGKQECVRLGVKNLRIGYRHGKGDTANVAFADGHVSPVPTDKFPRSKKVSLEAAHADNLGSGPTLYSDPERYLAQ